MLVLAFPEIQWVFYSPYTVSVPKYFSKAHVLVPGQRLDSLCRLHHAGFVPLFDPCGIRELIRDNLRQDATGGDAQCAYLPRRKMESVVLDEEAEYAYFMGYVAYRCGYRSWSMSSMAIGCLMWCEPEGTAPGACRCPGDYLLANMSFA